MSVAGKVHHRAWMPINDREIKSYLVIDMPHIRENVTKLINSVPGALSDNEKAIIRLAFLEALLSMPRHPKAKPAHEWILKFHKEQWYPRQVRCILPESNCQNLRTQMNVWTLDDTGNGYGDWKNYLEYDSYDGKRVPKSKTCKIRLAN